MNESNRTAIVLLAALWIVLMAVVIFAAWAADVETVERLDDFVRYLDDHRDNVSRLILTLAALVLIVLSLLVIIVQLTPEEQAREIRVEQAGATTIVPAEPLRLRLEEALTAMVQITAAKVSVFSKDKGIGMKLDLTVTPGTNIAAVTQEASRVVMETLQADLGLPVSAPPTVRIAFGPPKVEPVASSVTQPPAPQPPPPTEPVFPAPTAPVTLTADEPASEAAQQAAIPESEGPAEPPPPAPDPEAPPPAPGPEAPPPAETTPQDEPQRDETQHH
jgi:hypothetical protein